MSLEQQKLSLIEIIASTDDEHLIIQLMEILHGKGEAASEKRTRKAGFAKGTFLNIADDFDEVIPPGFEDYMLTSSTPE